MHVANLIRKFRRSESGASAVEFALIATFLSIILLNIVDIAIFMFKKMEITGAVRAGAQYALVAKENATIALIEGVVQDATDITPLPVTVDDALCGCSDGSEFVCGAGTCGAGTTGRMINSWGKLDMSDPNRHVHTGYSIDPDSPPQRRRFLRPREPGPDPP